MNEATKRRSDTGEERIGETARQAPDAGVGAASLGLAGVAGLGAALLMAPLAGYGAYQLYKQTERATESAKLAHAAAYDLTELKKVDAGLIKYQELKRIETGMKSPRAIAVDGQGNLLVAGERLVRRFSASGGFSDIISLAQAPFALASAPDGSIYVAMRGHVEVFSPDGKPKATWKAFGERAWITCIAIAGDEIYVADAGRRVVYRCAADGTVLAELGQADPAKGVAGLVVPSPHLDVAVGAEGLVWIANPGMHRLEAFRSDGQPDRQWGQAGTGVYEFFGCCNPTDFALLSDGSFVTAEKGIARIKKFHADGRFDCVVAAPDSFSENVVGLDLAGSANGQILVLERGTNVVRVFAPKSGGQS